MKILALQGSPRPKKYTQMVLEKFLEGAASKGAEFEITPLAHGLMFKIYLLGRIISKPLQTGRRRCNRSTCWRR
ncbi:MAG: NAD(P)H-dependent oxidoreductase [Deltaproteobacteria bacterium]|nr:NAD(P)H-dependent oxidoreductase [Deltaproteobacteria bacterium]